jgi:ComF family protein
VPALTTFLAAAGEALLALASPPRCASCDARVSGNTVFCPPCARSVERAPRESDGVFLWGGALAKAIARFKYEDATHLARPLSELLRHARTRDFAPAPTLVVPVPLHPRRLAERGFNQAALLARPLARDLGAALALHVLVRTKDTARQAALERSARLVNLEGAFRARRRLDGHHVLLVDDVCTTGATLRACAGELTRVGATVRNLVLAVSL